MRNALRLVATLTAAVAFAACVEGKHEPHFVPSGYAAYSSKQFDFGVAYPTAWIARRHDSVPVEVFAPEDFAIEIFIGRRDLVESADLQSFVEVLRGNDARTLSEPVTLEVDGESALRYQSDGEQPSIVVVFVEDGTPWVFSLSVLLGDASDLTEFEPVFDQTVATFRRD